MVVLSLIIYPMNVSNSNGVNFNDDVLLGITRGL